MHSSVCFFIAGFVLNRFELVAISFSSWMLLFYNRRPMLDKWIPDQLVFLGTISYSIYLTHGFLAIPLNLAINSPQLMSVLGPLVLITSAVIFSVVAAIVFHSCIEIPGMRLSKRIRLDSKSK